MKISSKFKSIQSSIFCAVSILVLSAVLVVTVVSLKHAIYAVNRLTNKKTVSVMHLFSTYNVHIQDSFLLFFQLCQHF